MSRLNTALMKVREEKLPEKMLVKNHYIQHPYLNFSHAEGFRDMFKPGADEEPDVPHKDSDNEEDEDLKGEFDDEFAQEQQKQQEHREELKRIREEKRNNSKRAKKRRAKQARKEEKEEKRRRARERKKRLASKKGASYIRAKYDFKRQIEEDWTKNMQERFIRMKGPPTFHILDHTYNIPRNIFEMWFGPESELDETVQCEIIKIIGALYGGRYSKHMLVEACDVYIRKDDEDDEDDEDGKPFGDPVEPNTDDEPIARLRLKLKRWVVYPAKMKRVAANKKIAQMKKRAGGLGFGSINQFRKFL